MWTVFLELYLKYFLVPFLLFCAALALYEWIDEKMINRRENK